MRWGKPASPTTPEVWPPHPPPGETDLERAVRLEEEKEAKRISDAIDHDLELDKVEWRKRKYHTRILLLGQAESGKSTMLKNFQLHFTPETFHAEVEAWRAVIHLNLIRSVNFILDLLPNSRANTAWTPDPGANYLARSSPLDKGFQQLRMRLSPLRQVEQILVRRLSADESAHSVSEVEESMPWYYGRASEVSVRGGSGWKALIRRRYASPPNIRPDEMDSARQILHACREDIVDLWTDPLIQAELKVEGVSLQEQSGFFLDEAARVASANYEPTLHDILRARLQTIGVEEHTMTVEKFGEATQHWIFYDVGGARGQRASWVPYFDDINAVLFLCPMSAFDEVLLEDRSVNRLADSFDLWKTICTSKLLAMTTFILLLNKSDVLKAKLDAGISFARYVKSYKDGPNDFENVSSYLKRKFIAILQHYSPKERQMHDINTTALVITRIKEAIIVNNLISSDYL
ncbi:uncharacterized protein FIBRA_04602 [Fibroporia radiculosa]|uniref:G-alpha-domain-containing protein n=1 Tax=Fibroporia radiculosa TaxID=599839 RepID=J4GPI4_9APHY|nr:uncharacterized protein FIBRA_04602 [Fibroporia radiculosa]CCM02500.1 predicted protein [Fibroporia radiculosa]